MGWRRLVGYRLLPDYHVALYFWGGAGTSIRNAGERREFWNRSLGFRDSGISVRAIDLHLQHADCVLPENAFSWYRGTGRNRNSVERAERPSVPNLHWRRTRRESENRGVSGGRPVYDSGRRVFARHSGRAGGAGAARGRDQEYGGDRGDFQGCGFGQMGKAGADLTPGSQKRRSDAWPYELFCSWVILDYGKLRLASPPLARLKFWRWCKTWRIRLRTGGRAPATDAALRRPKSESRSG